MKPCNIKNIILTSFLVLAAAMAVTAAPINFNEVSLWVRARETDQSIVREVAHRKLAHALTPQQESTSDSAVDNLHIFEVTPGHPINLSQWGGPDYEFAFNVYRFAGEDIVEPVIVDTVRSYTELVTYVDPLRTNSRTVHSNFHRERFTPCLLYTSDAADEEDS